jgi:threonylcarbamoyladenosine tRNA methylthiotransferase MtaB
MLRRLLLAVPELPRLRLSSLDPAEVDEDVFRLIAEEPRLMPHFHISVQAGDDMILKRMKRRHGRGDVIAFTQRVRALRPDAVFGADLIAGFPTETDAMFQNTLDLIDDAGLTHLHVFPYSIRPGTPAAKMPQVHGATIKARAATLRERGNTAFARLVEGFVGTTADVLMEQPQRGHSAHYVPVEFDAPQMPGAVIRATLTKAMGHRLSATALS